jgi:hypothetical protein
MALALIHFVDGADIGMIQSRSRARFALKSLQRLLVADHVGGKKLYRNIPAQPKIAGAIYDTHPAATQAIFYAIVGDGFAEHAATAGRTAMLGL